MPLNSYDLLKQKTKAKFLREKFRTRKASDDTYKPTSIEVLKSHVNHLSEFIKVCINVQDNGVGISNVDKIFKDYGSLKEHKHLNP